MEQNRHIPPPPPPRPQTLGTQNQKVSNINNDVAKKDTGVKPKRNYNLIFGIIGAVISYGLAAFFAFMLLT